MKEFQTNTWHPRIFQASKKIILKTRKTTKDCKHLTQFCCWESHTAMQWPTPDDPTVPKIGGKWHDKYPYTPHRSMHKTPHSNIPETFPAPESGMPASPINCRWSFEKMEKSNRLLADRVVLGWYSFRRKLAKDEKDQCWRQDLSELNFPNKFFETSEESVSSDDQISLESFDHIQAPRVQHFYHVINEVKNWMVHDLKRCIGIKRRYTNLQLMNLLKASFCSWNLTQGPS